MPKQKKIPERTEIKARDKWDLAPLFKTDAAWERAYKKLEAMVPQYAAFRGTLRKSARQVRACLDFDTKFDKAADAMGTYAGLKASENVADSTYQGMLARFTYLMTIASEAASFITPEIRGIPKKTMDKFLASKELAEYRFLLEKLLRYRPHILSQKEERLLAMQGEVADTADKVFGQLNDADLKFGMVKNEKGEEVELSHSSFRSLLESPERRVRKRAFHQYHAQYEQHANTIAATLSGSVLQDVYNARARKYPSALEAALFADRVPVQVYDNLIGAVHANLGTVYRYLELRRKALGIRDIHMYDTYVPIVKRRKVNIPYDNAVDTICQAMAPLGPGYVNTLRKGLLDGRWVDRYENRGKRSGAFSSGCYGSPPYILMNYKPDVINSMFTLAHEAGHSMHSYNSWRNQPFIYAHYVILVAEVASTFNEQLLNHYLLGKAKTRQERAYLVNKEIDEIRGTIVRQTMFAEFEKVIHAMAEQGMPLTTEALREEYRKLLEQYFGPDFVVDDDLELEGLRIPHFYRAFYVYKYATGLSAAIALSTAVLEEGTPARDRYLRFLKSGGSKYPLDLLRDAGVDLERPEPVALAMGRFERLVDELESLL